MSAKPLGRVLDPTTLDVVRGPDGRVRLTVPQAWLDEGAHVELEIPRTLICERCGGGGCDRCHRSGALVTRSKHDPVELIELYLPSGSGPTSLRIPHRGGLPGHQDNSELRGHLLITVIAGATCSTGVRRIDADRHESIGQPKIIHKSSTSHRDTAKGLTLQHQKLWLIIVTVLLLALAIMAWQIAVRGKVTD